MSEARFRAAIRDKYTDHTVQHVFPVFWHEWECDGWAAVTQRPDGRRVLITTNHGGLYVEENPDKFLKDRRKEYSKAAAQTMHATRLLNDHSNDDTKTTGAR